MAAHQQAQYQAQVPQHQTVGQQRQVPTGQQQQQAFGQAQQRPAQSQQHPLNPYANYDPQLASFILEKPKHATSWEDAEPERQHVALQELQSELHKFRRNHGNVKKNMNDIPSPNCRRIINELVEDQNVELAKYNRSIQYRIASVVNKWRSVNRRERQLVRVDIILETEPSGFQEPMQAKIMVPGGPQDPNKVKQVNPQNQHFPNQPNPGQNAGQQQQQRPAQQQQHHHQQQPQQHPGHGNINQGPIPGNPPPPPPPPGVLHDMGGPPHPPINGGGRPMPGPMQHPQPHHPPNGQRPMPGTFPEQLPMPPHHMRHNQGRPIEVLNPNHHRHQKPRRKNHRDTSSSSSDSESSWEDESEDSSFVNIEHDDHIDAGRRERGRQRHFKKPKKSQKHRSLSKARGLSRSRSRSRSRARRNNADPYSPKVTRRRRASDLIDDPRNGRLSPESFTTDSSRGSHNKISGHIPPVHIHLNTNNVVEDRTRNGNAPPTDLYNGKRKAGKQYTAHDMARESSSSSLERGSGTESMNTTSAHTADDGVWDRPIRRRPSFKHVHSRRKSPYRGKPQTVLDQPHPSHIYDDEIDHRGAQKIRYPDELVDDYPHPRSPRVHMREPESYFDDHAAHAIRPNMHHRRATMANLPNAHNPFAQTHFPPKPLRASSYLADRHGSGYSFPQQRALTDRDEPDERFGLSDIHAALEHIQEKKDMRYSMRRPNVMGRRDSALQFEDEWNIRVPLGGRRGGYERY